MCVRARGCNTSHGARRFRWDLCQGNIQTHSERMPGYCYISYILYVFVELGFSLPYSVANVLLQTA